MLELAYFIVMILLLLFCEQLDEKYCAIVYVHMWLITTLIFSAMYISNVKHF